MAPPFSSSNYETTIINSSQIIDRGIKGIDIGLATIELNNLSAAAIASLSGGGGGLTENSVNSSHIINGTIGTEDISDNAITGSKIAIGTITSSNIADGTILGTDISFGQIGEAHFDASFNTNLTAFAVALEEIGDAIKELQKLQGVISIRNSTTYDQDFTYMLSYKHPITGVLTTFASYSKLSYKLTATHFFKLPSLTHTILIEVSNAGGVGVEGADVLYGATIEEIDGNNILLTDLDVNIMVEINVAI